MCLSHHRARCTHSCSQLWYLVIAGCTRHYSILSRLSIVRMWLAKHFMLDGWWSGYISTTDVPIKRGALLSLWQCSCKVGIVFSHWSNCAPISLLTKCLQRCMARNVWAHCSPPTMAQSLYSHDWGTGFNVLTSSKKGECKVTLMDSVWTYNRLCEYSVH